MRPLPSSPPLSLAPRPANSTRKTDRPRADRRKNTARVVLQSPLGERARPIPMRFNRLMPINNESRYRGLFRYVNSPSRKIIETPAARALYAAPRRHTVARYCNYATPIRSRARARYIADKSARGALCKIRYLRDQLGGYNQRYVIYDTSVARVAFN